MTYRDSAGKLVSKEPINLKDINDWIHNKGKYAKAASIFAEDSQCPKCQRNLGIGIHNCP